MINPELIDFLIDLSVNNHRDWFQQNKERHRRLQTEFEAVVDALILRIAAFDPSLKGLQAKDALFRIYRDVRFSANKEPYKTHMGAYMAPGGRNSEMAGYYLHIEPGASMLAGGLYCPLPASLKQVRQHIDTHYSELQGILAREDFRQHFGLLQGEQLKTAPKGYPKDHPAVELLRMKSFTFVKQLSDDQLQDPNLVEYLADTYRQALDLNRYLNAALQNPA